MQVKNLPNNPLSYPSLVRRKEVDQRFKEWEPWMIPGRTFKTRRNTVTIVCFCKNGFCFVKFNSYSQLHKYTIEAVRRLLTNHSPNSPHPVLVSGGD